MKSDTLYGRVIRFLLLPVKILFGLFQMRFFWLSNRLTARVVCLTWANRLVSFLLKLMVKNGGKYEPMDLQRLIELSNKASEWCFSFHLPASCNILLLFTFLSRHLSALMWSQSLDIWLVGQGPIVVLSAWPLWCNRKNIPSLLTLVTELPPLGFSFKLKRIKLHIKILWLVNFGSREACELDWRNLWHSVSLFVLCVVR